MLDLRSFMTRLLNTFRRSRVESDLAEQLDAHREMIKAVCCREASNLRKRTPPRGALWEMNNWCGNFTAISCFHAGSTEFFETAGMLFEVSATYRSLRLPSYSRWRSESA
jgi:hypothetical protein